MNKPILYIWCSRARFVWRLTFLLSLCTGAGWAQVSVLTQHNDNSRTGANLNETTLTTANVNVSTFGKLFNMPVDGFVFAQPLYMPNVTLPNLGKHNVLFVATAHDSVYAFDADTGTRLWKVSLGTPVPSSVINTPAIQVEVGIVSTPVIDPNTNTLYVVAKTYEPPTNPVQIYRLHALNIFTGAERTELGSPVQIAAQYPGSGVPNLAGQVQFDAAQHLQRTAVTLVNGVIYLAFASHEDRDPYHGWVLAYSAANLKLNQPQPLATYNDTPNSMEGGIWMSGQGLVADSKYVYLITGNSLESTDNMAGDYGESFLKLAQFGVGLPQPPLSKVDYFKAHNYHAMNLIDEDLGSGGPVGIPGTVYIVGGGKQGLLYLVNTNDMGQLQSTTDRVVQEFQADNGLWGSPVFWNTPSAPTLYVWGVNDSLKAFRYNFSAARFNTTAASASSVKTPNGDDPCGVLSVSSNQSVNGIVWATIPLADPINATVHGKLYAFDATNVGNELWDSGQNPLRDDYGNFAKFCPPTVANGKVYVATDSLQVCAYGLNPPAPAWHHTDISASANANLFPAAGDPSGYVLGSSEFVVYRGTDNHVHQLFATANQGPWSHADLTALTNQPTAPLAKGNPFGYVSGGGQRVVYLATDSHIHQLSNNGTQWTQADLTSLAAGASAAGGDPFALPSGPSGEPIITYKGADQHIHALWINGSGVWAHTDMTAAVTNAPLSAGDPSEYVKAGNIQIVPFRAADNDIHALYTINNNTKWTQTDVSASAHVPAAAAANSDPIGYILGDQYIDYRGQDNHIHQLFVPAAQWATADLTLLTGAPPATGNLFGYVFGSVAAVVYRNMNNNDIDQLFGSGTQWGFTDLSTSAGAPASAGDPFAYTFGNQVVVYRGTETGNHIHLLYRQ